MPAPIQSGKWYEITLEVGYDKVDCYLDGKLLMTYTEPQKFFSIEGRDNKTGDLIVKVVNASDRPYKATLKIEGAEIKGDAQVITSTADSPAAENSLSEPKKYVPVSTRVSNIANESELECKPYSIMFVRLQDKAWKKQ
ncbi:MAG: hypothetical protein J7502_07695 [Flavisolibacter sp.]|nr:hypothetical protein [Flavisolibacter sp.]